MGETALFVQGDVASYEDQVKLFRESWDRWQRLDVFIANAGIVDVGSRYNLAHKTAAKHVMMSLPSQTSVAQTSSSKARYMALSWPFIT